VQDGDQQMITVVGYEATEQGEDYWILNWRTVGVQNGGKTGTWAWSALLEATGLAFAAYKQTLGTQYSSSTSHKNNVVVIINE
jgi:hypothetical protein